MSRRRGPPWAPGHARRRKATSGRHHHGISGEPRRRRPPLTGRGGPCGAEPLPGATGEPRRRPPPPRGRGGQSGAEPPTRRNSRRPLGTAEEIRRRPPPHTESGGPSGVGLLLMSPFFHGSRAHECSLRPPAAMRPRYLLASWALARCGRSRSRMLPPGVGSLCAAVRFRLPSIWPLLVGCVSVGAPVAGGVGVVAGHSVRAAFMVRCPRGGGGPAHGAASAPCSSLDAWHGVGYRVLDCWQWENPLAGLPACSRRA